MRTRLYAQLCAVARRECGDAASAEDVVQDALLAAIIAGRSDIFDPANARWLTGTVRNKARMARRGSSRRLQRETHWHGLAAPAEIGPSGDIRDVLQHLPPSLKAVAALALSGHTRQEIVWLLRLSDTALRQRISGLAQHMKAASARVPPNFPLLGSDLLYGRIRQTLLPNLLRQGGFFGSHDPDGHVFIVSRSQNDIRRQQGVGSQRRAQ